MIGVTKIDADREQLPQCFVHGKQDVIVERECTEFGETVLDPNECRMDGVNGYCRDTFEKCDTQPPTHDRQQNTRSRLSGHNEVTLAVTDTEPFFNAFRPLVDKDTVEKLHDLSSSFWVFFLLAFCKDQSAIRTVEKTIDCILSDTRKIAFPMSNPSRNRFRGLAVAQRAFDKGAERIMSNDFLSAEACVMSADVCFVLRFFRIVSSADTVDLVRYR